MITTHCQWDYIGGYRIFEAIGTHSAEQVWVAIQQAGIYKCGPTQVARDPAAPGGKRRDFRVFGFEHRMVQSQNAGAREHPVSCKKA